MNNQQTILAVSKPAGRSLKVFNYKPLKPDIMKSKIKICLTVLLMTFLWSCNYKTHVINTVHEDGSVTRTVIIKTDKNVFNPDDFRVPIDSTWQTDTTLEVGSANDTTWVFTAEKHFESVEGINLEYQNDKGSNSHLNRRADFDRKFRWFTTVFRFSETIDRILTVNCPMEEFFNEEEMKYIYLPESVQEELKNGPDSLVYKTLSDSIDDKAENWMWTCFYREWVETFFTIYGENPDLPMTREEMLSLESKVVEFIKKGEEEKMHETEKVIKGDSTDTEEDDVSKVVTGVFGPDFYRDYRTEIDSVMAVMEEISEKVWSAQKYDMEIKMPGIITGTNGYSSVIADSTSTVGIIWTVDANYFFSQTFEMWVESRINNYWAWIASGIFILFVLTGLILFYRKK